VTLGLAGPFARPGRTLVTLAAILFGAVAVTAFGGDASWIGYALISGHWYDVGEAAVNTSFLHATGKRTGDMFTLTDDGHAVTLKIAGEVLASIPDPNCST
jgi:putative ABC transport system permease protein